VENLREIVLDTLLTLEKEGGFSNQLIKDVLDKYDYLDRTMKAFMKRVLEGTIERQIELDFYLDAYSKTPVRKMKPLIRCLLRMSTYQLLFMDSVPDSAVCNEACKLADKRGFHTLKGFVNGVLRTISKNKNSLPLPDLANEKLYLSVRYSMPQDIVALLLSQYGSELTKGMLEALMEVHPVTIRMAGSLSKAQREAVCDKLKQGGVEVIPSPYMETLMSLQNMETVAGLPGFEEGFFTIQDGSSAMAVAAAGIQTQDVVMDLCAAPGGKSMLAAEKASRVLAFDVTETKCTRMEENMARMGLTNVSVMVQDAREPREELYQKADVLLLDVPCSGLGIMGKKRDIKYHFEQNKLQELYTLQKEIVTAGVKCLKPGGTLLYSTCTMNEKENQAMAQYIQETLKLEPVSLQKAVPEKVWEERMILQEMLQQAGRKALPDHMMLLVPGVMQTDGFFFAKFRRPETCLI